MQLRGERRQQHRQHRALHARVAGLHRRARRRPLQHRQEAVGTTLARPREDQPRKSPESPSHRRNPRRAATVVGCWPRTQQKRPTVAERSVTENSRRASTMRSRSTSWTRCSSPSTPRSCPWSLLLRNRWPRDHGHDLGPPSTVLALTPTTTSWTEKPTSDSHRYPGRHARPDRKTLAATPSRACEGGRRRRATRAARPTAGPRRAAACPAAARRRSTTPRRQPRRARPLLRAGRRGPTCASASQMAAAARGPES
mmetsp:Transcript_8922/g.23184  ORF Transcript_8922/g.23184 Transcript_8922/m.23184 type:complete len:255 (+) Transcript_8922:262-1026(+)